MRDGGDHAGGGAHVYMLAHASALSGEHRHEGAHGGAHAGPVRRLRQSCPYGSAIGLAGPPSGGSTLMTSAPISARMRPQIKPFSPARSRTRRPSIGRFGSMKLAAGAGERLHPTMH